MALGYSKIGIVSATLMLISTMSWAWDYEDTNWMEGVCNTGIHQSPVDLAVAIHGTNPKLKISYQHSVLDLVNNGHTVQENVDPGSFLVIDGKHYDLIQFHFHTPSEHVVNASAYPMEVHFVNKASDGTLAVIGVFVSEGTQNPTFQKILDNAPLLVGETKSATTINPAHLLGDDNNQYYTYSGSLTTPPCSEIVRWNVMREPISFSTEQITRFKEFIHLGHNARPVQPLNDRSVTVSGR